ncbi:MAG: 16S rRNA (guanine(527)-N(7))-methyltransferase [Bacteroidetes bacterium GWF2_42_66]|nr:MAG: 16S rRNA (guanine(527)-N(7))-methyltransferase [Bacteroidetes bacterium GWA2_42_15]OFX99746.1 MAG: 16S rRNA (guanine(527)-N(7))-methyltransferase [Bacteroidetes bacterium GWE2_42_39]OFY39784.1 MAG: 16S rRNA (guanine(527)-N(7))-methyltransferase [Bacteroidetes bacterium GWF2_42_66]HBL74782.1 16S rRNA (guanine(527)-N(7))-methyltransferase RsmG [Prolixibacteraceae bacterium]HCR90745.1 16S rRNA (guanine(527)-N(7))-methyltransferase RsmG [Prolixibacteraceae bacterium]
MNIIRKYFPGLNDLQMEQLGMLRGLYEEWNARINVVSRKDIEQLYERHVLHSMSIAKFIQFVPRTQIMDVGTGGGFPGIPLAILFPESDFYLVDSIAKKIKVVTEVASALELKNVKAGQMRAEQVAQQFDFVVSRAVTAFPDFVNLVKGKIKMDNRNLLANGILYLKGGDFEEEIKPFGNKAVVYKLDDLFDEEFFETKKLIHLTIKK